MQLIKPLYGIPEAGLHWWSTYYKHHRERLEMATSTYDPCLLLTEGGPLGPFGLVGMQIDDTLIVLNTKFDRKEEAEREKAGFLVKPKERLS